MRSPAPLPPRRHARRRSTVDRLPDWVTRVTRRCYAGELCRRTRRRTAGPVILFLPGFAASASEASHFGAPRGLGGGASRCWSAVSTEEHGLLVRAWAGGRCGARGIPYCVRFFVPAVRQWDGLLGPARRAGPSPLRSACARRRGRGTCPRLAARASDVFAPRPGPNGPGPGSPSWRPGPRRLRTRTRSSSRRSGPVGHGSPHHVTSATCGARTGPAGPVAPPAGAGSRDPIWRGRGGDVILRSRFPTYKLSVTVTWRTEGGRAPCPLARSSAARDATPNSHPVEIPCGISRCRRMNLP